MSGQIHLKGELHTWDFGGVKREYIVVTLPFGQASNIFRPDIYNHKTNKGEQRTLVDRHVKSLQTAMETGHFTPTTVSVGLKKSHNGIVSYENDPHTGARMATVEFNEDLQPLSLLDGGQRFGAITKMRKSATPEVQSKIDNLPVTATIYLDGSTKDDFINLNQGKPVDAAHLLSLRIKTKTVAPKDQPYYDLANGVAKILNDDVESPFVNCIRFNSSGNARLTLNTLCSKGSSDIGTSLMGLARVALHVDGGPHDAEAMAEIVKTCHRTLKEQAPDLLMPNKVITSPGNGTKGSATMLIGLAVCYAYRLSLDDKTEDEVQKEFVQTAKDFLDEMISGNFSGPIKRDLLGKFAQGFFRTCEVDKHHGVPKELVKMLSASTFALPKLPKEKKEKVSKPKNAKPGRPRGRKKAATEETTAPMSQAVEEAFVQAQESEQKLVEQSKQDQAQFIERQETLQKEFLDAAVIPAQRDEVAKQTPQASEEAEFKAAGYSDWNDLVQRKMWKSMKEREEREQRADRLTESYDADKTGLVDYTEETPAGEELVTAGAVTNNIDAPWEDEIVS